MPEWNPQQYLKFADERTRPCRDLAAAIPVSAPGRIIDLGCGPGNSTRILAEKWPDAEITGLDNAAPMIDAARREQPRHRWVMREIAEWADHEREQFDIVFSNAALQWAPDHHRLISRLFEHVRPGGALAFQVPANQDAPPHRLMRELAPAGLCVRDWSVREPAFYYDVLAPEAVRVDIWRTEYQHVLPNSGAIIEWYKGTGLRPFLEAIASGAERERFLASYRERIDAAYPPQPDGSVLFPFLRLFVIASKAGPRINE